MDSLGKMKSSDVTIKKGLTVTLIGLQNASYLNGRIGVVTGDPMTTTSNSTSNGCQRFPVKIEGLYKSPTTGNATEDVISIKEENLRPAKKYQCCSGCLRDFDKKALKKCSKCQLVRYCGEICQREHWNREHKEDCKILRKSRKSIKDDSVPLPDNKKDRVYFIMNRGMRFMQLKDYMAAEQDFRTLLEVEHFHVLGSYHNLGAVLAAQQKWSEALPYLETAVTMEPLEGINELRAAYDLLPLVQLQTGNKAAALTTLQRALKIWPGDPDLQGKLESVRKRN